MDALSGLLDGGTMQFLPIRLSLYLILGGMLVGSVGGLVAAALPDAAWADVVGVCVGTMAAVPPYALVTQVRWR